MSSLLGGGMGRPSVVTSTARRPFLRILEQPKTNSLRFRYQCEVGTNIFCKLDIWTLKKPKLSNSN